MTTANPFAGHALRVPRLSVERARAIAADEFGVEGEVQELASQQDQNFQVETARGRFVLKVCNPAFSTEELDLQNRAMAHVAARHPGVVPVPLRSRIGTEVVKVDGHDIRLITYLDGEPLYDFVYLAPAVLRATARMVARIAAALSDFDHPAAERVLQWDIARTGDVVAGLLPWVEDEGRRSLFERTTDRALSSLEPLAPSLRRQVIHGDANVHNLLVERDDAERPQPVGLVDFGDCCRSWLAAECAVFALSVGVRRSTSFVSAAAELVGGFHAAFPLIEEEVRALPALIAARAALSATSCHQQATLEPDKAYAVQGARDTFDALRAVAEVPDRLLHTAFLAACDMRAPVVEPLPRGQPLARELEGGATTLLDLSTTSQSLHDGAWRDPAALAALVDESAIAVGRHGEGRLDRDCGPTLDEPASVHLGTDVFLAPGTKLLAPVAGRVVSRSDSEITLALENDNQLRLAGVEPAEPERFEAGDIIGLVAEPEPGARLPAHVHVQLSAGGLSAMPGHVPPSLAAHWLALCPDAGPLIGLPPTAAREPAEQVLNRRRRAVASPQRLYYPSHPPQFERGWKQWLYSVQGRPFLDLINNVAVVGHAHPAVTEAATRQLRLLNTNSRFLYDALGRFCERLARLAPDPLEVVFCVNSGSEAVDLALRLARENTGRRDLVCFSGAYHGWTTAASETQRPSPWVHAIDPPRIDPERSLEQLRQAVERDPPAAFLCEALLGNWGGVLLPDGWLADAYRVVHAAGGLCIADEVQVGYGRSGRHFWAFEQQAVVPDLVTLAKPAGNGHPLGAVITTRALADGFNAGDKLFSSPGGAPVSCEIGLAVLDIIEREDLQQNARRVGDELTSRLAPLIEEFEPLAALHGRGLYRGLELSRPDGTPASGMAAALCERLLELGVIVQPTGPAMNVLKLKPPLCVGRDDIDLLGDALRRALTEGW